MTYTTQKTNIQNLDRSQRVSRSLVAITLLGITVSAPVTTLGGLSVLPLVAIYPLITALLGWDPIFDIFGWGVDHADSGKLHSASRAELALTGAGLIGSVFVAPITSVSVLALAGIFPMVAALIGEDLLQSVKPDSRRRIPEVRYEAQPGIADSTAKVSAAIDEIHKPSRGRRAA